MGWRLTNVLVFLWFLSPLPEFDHAAFLPSYTGLKNLFVVNHRWGGEIRMSLGWKKTRDVSCVFLGCLCWNTNSPQRCAASARRLNPAAALRRGTDSSEARADAKSCDGLHQVEILRIARTWTDSNAQDSCCDIEASNNYQAKCVTLQLYGNLRVFYMDLAL